MATIRERLIYAIELVTDRAQAGVRGFRQSVADADGTVNKFKAGAASAMSTVQANAGALAVAGGAALVTFGTKSVNAFQDTAIAAGKFSDATGVAVEDASRLIEVAGDVGVNVGTIESALVRMNNAAGKGDLQKLGIELQRTSDGAVDVNATFLETVRVLEGIEDPTERAVAAQKIFGRSYREAAEIIFSSADDLAEKLGEVSEQKVIDEDELAKSREFRGNMDDLTDTLEDVQLAAGETLVPLLSDIARVIVQAREGKAALEDMAAQVPGGSRVLTGLFSPGLSDEIVSGAFGGALTDIGRAVGVIGDEAQQAAPATEAEATALDHVAEASDRSGTSLTGVLDGLRDFHGEADQAAEGADRFGDAIEEALARRAEQSVDRFEAAIDRVLTKIDEAFGETNERLRQQDILADIADGWDQIAEAQEEATEGGEQERRDYERQVRDQRRAVLDLLGSIETLPASKVIELATEIETASLGELQRIVADLSSGITVPVSFQRNPGFESVGGTFSATQATPIINGVQSAIPSGPMANITYNFPVGTNPTSVYVDQQTDIRRNGAR